MQILGIACAVPENRIGSGEFRTSFGEENVEKIAANTGVSERRQVRLVSTCASDLDVAAAEMFFEKTGISRDSVDAVLFISQTPDYLIPATSGILQARLGLSDRVLPIESFRLMRTEGVPVLRTD